MVPNPWVRQVVRCAIWNNDRPLINSYLWLSILFLLRGETSYFKEILTNEMNKLINMNIGLFHMAEKTETCGNEERVSVVPKLYRNLLHQVSADWNFAETFKFVSTLLKLNWNLHIRFPWTETWRNQAETIVSALIAETIQKTSTPSFYIVSAVFQFCWNGIFHPV